MDELQQRIHDAFGGNPYPGDAYLVGSRQGDEPEEEIAPFRAHRDWREVPAALLDAHGGALHFFSEAGLRFFLPVFLLADLDGALDRADPIFTLTHGFADAVVEVAVGGALHRRAIGGSALVNPLLYGAMTARDHARARLSVFCREEAAAIAAYLQARRADPAAGTSSTAITAALDTFWYDRAARAPTRADLEAHQRALRAFLGDVAPGG